MRRWIYRQGWRISSEWSWVQLEMGLVTWMASGTLAACAAGGLTTRLEEQGGRAAIPFVRNRRSPGP